MTTPLQGSGRVPYANRDGTPVVVHDGVQGHTGSRTFQRNAVCPVCGRPVDLDPGTGLVKQHSYVRKTSIGAGVVVQTEDHCRGEGRQPWRAKTAGGSVP